MKRTIITVCLCILALTTFAQQSDIKCYPTNWWIGMKNPKLQIMMHGKDIGEGAGITVNYPGVKLQKINKVESKNYLFLDLDLGAATKSGTMNIVIKRATGTTIIPYQLQGRRVAEDGKTRIKGVTAADNIYLIMPDRFANGDPSNDNMPGFREAVNSRDSLKGRHGGDLQGISKHLDYIKNLGITAIWINPVIVNDMPRESFHGYAFTDHYTIDARLGGDKAYMDLIESAHKEGLKIIQDAVYNHVGLYHFTVQDLPMKDWLNQWPTYQNTTYKDQTLMDPYASSMDRKIMSDGWFTPMMPDLNQKNPYVANFLIQHALWTTEHYGVDGWRIDTYAYCDLDFMNKCNKALLDQYPRIGIFAETWVNGITNQAFFASNNYSIPYKSNLPGVTDFQLHFAMDDALNQNYGWTEGLSKLYLTLAKDFVYKDPYKNCIFLDNHDISRVYSTVGENFDKYKMAINWLFTLRGIPEIYYGTEVLMTGSTHPSDALVRKDFSGGWDGDKDNKFTQTGRTEKENEAFNYVRTLINYRKNTPALQTGKLMQYVPFDGLYVYFRYDNSKTVMVVSNSNDKDIQVKMDRFTERTSGFLNMKNIFTGKVTPIADFIVGPKGSGVYELIK
jgi:neopullulanase